MTDIFLLATGSRGDVQPFVALGYALQQAGYRVEMVSNAMFAGWIRGYGLGFRPIAWDPQESMRSQPEFGGLDPHTYLRGIRQIQENNRRVFNQVQSESLQACRDARRLIYSFLAPWGWSIAEKLGIPAIAGALHPVTPTSAFPSQLFPSRSLGGPLNRLSHALVDHALTLLIGEHTNRFRREVLALPPIRFPHTLPGMIRAQPGPLLCSLSPTVIPRPPDWPASVHMDGYWFLPAAPGWQPDPALATFIEAGDPPVYIGFGSMAHQDAAQTTEIALGALRRAGLRGVLASGWGGLGAGEQAAGQVFVLSEAPHDWLFPRMAAVVHHGGAGTTAAALRAGVPAVVVPHMQDQPYWGQRVYDLGAGPRPISRRTLTAANLAERLTAAVHDASIRDRASRLGAQIRAEQGVECAMQAVRVYFGL